jgi:hypothetical protein
MEEERHYNEIAMSGGNMRSRTVSSPVPYNPSPSSSRPLSPGEFCKRNGWLSVLLSGHKAWNLILFHVHITAYSYLLYMGCTEEKAYKLQQINGWNEWSTVVIYSVYIVVVALLCNWL